MKRRRPLYIDLDEGTRQALESAAKADQRSMADYVRKLIVDDFTLRSAAGLLSGLRETA
jgi:hypothetical protein